MSASVASSAVGLLDRPFTPPADPRDSRAPEWQDHMDVDRSSQDQPVDKQTQITSEKVRRRTSDADSGNERRNALSGLLAALATNPTSAQPAPSHNQDREHRSVTPPQDSPISVASPSRPGSSKLPTESAHVDTSLTGSNIAATTSNPNEAHLLTVEGDDANPTNAMTLPDVTSTTVLQTTDSTLAMPMSTSLDNIPIPAFEMPSDPPPQTPPTNSSPINIKRQYDAFARLEFDDGIFYLNTYQCELGRDQHAYHMALRREREAQEAAELAKPHPESSGGRASQRSNIIKAESQIQGSVVSEAGGFAGVDEQPIEAYGQDKSGQSGLSRGSPSSDASIVRPADVLHNPSLHTPFDYNKEASRQFGPSALLDDKAADEDEQPAPITADHLPDPNSCPLIPIHVTSESETTELDGLKAISRRHMKIFWSWENSSFMLEVLGRNGAFLEGEFIAPSDVVPLYTGANIQISSVNFVFRLPHVEPESPSVESVSNIGEPLDRSLTNASELSDSAQKAKLKLKLNVDGAGSQTVATNGESRRRGPGRPPKDGVMSQRERKEREKADKEARTRALNGDPSPPAPQRKPSKPQLPKPEQISDSTKPEKRKYNKRKREDGEDEQVLPSIEAPDETPVIETPQPPPVAKKARTKSYSPPYKPKEECTQADLTRPAHNYAVLLYQVLSQTGEISLRQIYKEMQSRWPFFKYMVESDGWTSSVRHNLNQEVGKLFVKGRKEGKGYTWLAKPNAMEEYQAQKNKRSNAPAAPRPRPAPTRANFAPSQGQQLTWQNSGPVSQQNGAGNALAQPGQWNPQQNNHQRPNQPGGQIHGQPQMQGQMSNSQTPTHNLQDPEGPAPPHMIVTFLGVRIIDRFENTMMGQLRQRYQSEEEKMTKWSNVFRSARARCLNGSPASSLPEGETEDERTIMTHINNFVNMYKNPNFRGFFANSQPSNVSVQNTGSSASNLASSNATPPSANATSNVQASTAPTADGTPSQQAALSKSAANSTSVGTHGHPLPTAASVSETTTAHPNTAELAQAASSTSHGDVPSTVSATTSSSSAALPAATAASVVAAESSTKVDLSSSTPAPTKPASLSSGPDPVIPSAATVNTTIPASPSSLQGSANVSPRPAAATNREPRTMGHSNGSEHDVVQLSSSILDQASNAETKTISPAKSVSEDQLPPGRQASTPATPK